MLDTNIVSDIIRNRHGRAAVRLALHGPEGVCVSILTAAELRYGAYKRRSTTLTELVDGTLSRIEVIPFDVPADARYGILRSELEAAGNTIGPNDLLIAAHALTLKVVLATANIAEFSRVPGLAIENWLE